MSHPSQLEQEQALIIHDLRLRLEEAEEILTALRRGEVDALVVKPGERPQIWSLNGVDQVYRVLFETLNEGALTLSSDGSILYSNSQFAGLVGRRLQKVLGTHFLDYVIPSDVEVFRMLLEHGLRRSSRGEIRLLRPDGTVVPVQLSMNAVQIEGVGQTATAVVSDLSELKVAQAALADAKDALEVRVLERTAKLRQEIAERERLATELAERDRRKDEFLAMLGHELRNPLAPIMNAMEMLRLRGRNPDDVERARLVVERQIRNMARLVDDLLDVSRITRGVVELRRERVDLRASVESAVTACRSMVEVSQHELDLSVQSDACWMMGDATRLEQIVVNLISNACKYTPSGGRIACSLMREGAWAELSVRDTGRGIPQEMLPRIFDLFTQVDAPIDRSLGGLGIGLTIVRNLAELHGGTVHAESDGEGQGAEFLVRFPLLPSEISVSGPDRPYVHAPEQRLRILIVEDNVDAAETLAELLEIWGHVPQTIGHGQGAVDAALAVRPDVILLDIGLPGMDGYEVARLMRQQSELNGCLLVALTGYGQEDDRRRALAAGCDRHMTKPINSDQLQRLLASVGPQERG